MPVVGKDGNHWGVIDGTLRKGTFTNTGQSVIFETTALRHSHAQTLLAAGISELVVMRQLGHTSLRRVEEHYRHVPRMAQVMQLTGVVLQEGLV